MKKMILISTILILMFHPVLAEVEAKKIELPPSVYSIEEENTYINHAPEDDHLQPNKLAKQLLKSSNITIENPKLIQLLNETRINKNQAAFWYQARIYLGKWPLNYQSTKTETNWEYQLINTNSLNNRTGNSAVTLNYNQLEQRSIESNIAVENDDTQKMIIDKVAQQTNLPLTKKGYIGIGTKTTNKFQVPANKAAKLNAYASALKEKGILTFGEVYIVLKGSKRSIVVENISSKKIEGYIPIKNHVSFQLEIEN